MGGKVEAGCAKCCSYCRFSPLGTAVCYSKMMIKGGQKHLSIKPSSLLGAILITAATLAVYLFGAGLCKYFK